MKKMTSFEAAEAVHGRADGYAEFDRAVTDSREIVPGCLFIALVGERFDGHAFVAKAVSSGAAAVMAERKLDIGVPVITVSDTKKALLELAGFYRRSFGLSLSEFPFVAVTGSVGKTTTKEMIWHVLRAKYKAHKTYMNYNNEIGLPKSLLCLEEEHEAAVAELGMDGRGQIELLSRTALPNIAVITNIGFSHLEKLHSRDEILRAKLEITAGLAEGAPLILNGDDELLSALEPEDFGNKFELCFFGIEGRSKGNKKMTVTAKDISYAEDGTRFVVVAGERSSQLFIPACGEHNVYDALAAVCVGLKLGIPLSLIGKALCNYSPAGMREKISEVGGLLLIEDCYNAGPDSMKALAQTIGIKGKNRRKIAVIGDMLELGEYSDEAHELCGRYLVEAGVNILVTYGEKSRLIADSARKNGLFRVLCFDSRKELSKKLLQLLRKGDLVALKGSRGMKLEEVAEEIKAAALRGEII